jgi:streptogramin lyase
LSSELEVKSATKAALDPILVRSLYGRPRWPGPQTKKFTEYPVPASLLGPAVMRAFTDNKYLWFTAIAANAIGRIDITTGAMKAFPNTANIGVPIEDTNDDKGNICKY